MQVSWFFATTPIPQRPHVTPARKHPAARTATAWWGRVTDRFVSWGERSHKQANASLMHI